jgi:hypothetical protein
MASCDRWYESPFSYHVSSSSHGAAKALHAKRIIDKTSDGYRVFNPFFAAWFLKNMDY